MLVLSKQPVLYTPHHSSKKESIAAHVKKQLNKREKGRNKDFFFLTAFLDVSTQDEATQSFKRDNPKLKNDLIEIRNKHNEELKGIIKAYEGFDFRIKNAYEQFLDQNRKNFSTLLKNLKFERLFETVPGRFWLKGLVLLFLILEKVYVKNGKICIENIGDKLTSNNSNKQEEFLKEIKKIKGVGDKLARWAITNVDGSRFVIDTQIAKTIRKINKKYTLKIKENLLTNNASKNAETVWKTLFGSKNNGDWENFTNEDFNKIFIKTYNYKQGDYQYLMFIVTQTFWFYGRDRCLHYDTFPNH